LAVTWSKPQPKVDTVTVPPSVSMIAATAAMSLNRIPASTGGRPRHYQPSLVGRSGGWFRFRFRSLADGDHRATQVEPTVRSGEKVFDFDLRLAAITSVG
jgi:hypothetical protein